MEFILFIFLAMATVAFVAIQHDRRTKAWKQAARTLGFRFDTNSSTPKLHGMAGGRPVKVWVKRVGKNNHQTRYEVDFPVPIGPRLEIKREGGLSKMKRAVGFSDTEVGDHRFDEMFEIKADDPAAVTAFLTDDRKSAIMALAQLLPRVEVSTKELRLAQQGIEADAQTIVSIVSRMVATAEILDSRLAPPAVEAPTPAEVVLPDNVFELESLDPDHLINPPAPPAPRPRSPRPYMPQLDEMEPPESEPTPIPHRVPTPETVFTHEPEPAPVVEPEPAPPLVPEPEPEAAPKAAEPEPEVSEEIQPAAVEGDLDQDAVIADLLGSDRLGYEIDQLFDEHYLGQRVRWTGTVEKQRPFRTDRDFGTTPGTRVTALVGFLGEGRLVSKQVKAVVHLPEGVSLSRGETISFDGTLLRVDRFMRDIYVGDAFLWEHQQAG